MIALSTLRPCTAAAICGAALGLPLTAAGPAAADYNQVIAFRAAAPKCEANPNLRWIGRVAGQTDAPMSDFQVPVSFVGCFATQAACEKWRGHGVGLMTGRIVTNECRPR